MAKYPPKYLNNQSNLINRIYRQVKVKRLKKLHQK